MNMRELINIISVSALREQTEQRWLFHGTSSAYLKWILKDGLRPGMFSNHEDYGDGTSDYRYHSFGKLFFTLDMNEAVHYAEAAANNSNGEMVVLRVKRSDVGTLWNDPLGDFGSEVYTDDLVDRSAIEILQNGHWTPLLTQGTKPEA